jgi:hypothetical protein
MSLSLISQMDRKPSLKFLFSESDRRGLYRFHMKMHRKNPTACGTSPCQGEVRRGKNNMQLHKELVLERK